MSLSVMDRVLAEASSFMRRLEPADRTALMAHSSAMSAASGQVLFEKGDHDALLYVIIAGRVEISVTSVNGRRIALNILAKGDCFGEIGLLDGGARTASAMVLEPSRFMIVTRRGYLAAAEQRPSLAMAMIGILCERIRWVNAFLEDQTLLPLVQRLARRLLFLHGRFADQTGSLRISQSDIADFSGATREAVNKILAVWRQQHWISLSRSSIKVLNGAALAELADLQDYASLRGD
jgi:CRP/FNR family transcriptional regulator, cyclic AMP receptor protein